MDYHGRIVRIHVTLSAAFWATYAVYRVSTLGERPLFGNPFGEKDEKAKSTLLGR